ncbi:MAG TPA: O-antigen ligase family protein [Dictyobacter sp.]|nr:O-antigen ligase family protein [Dictyobacter sp.]
MHNSQNSYVQSNMSGDPCGTLDQVDAVSSVAVEPSTDNGKEESHRSSFWHDRLVECGLIISMALYYLIGNHNITIALAGLPQLNPLFALPFLVLFLVLACYRLPFAVALLPLTLPYYLLPKPVWRTASFSPAEITLWLIVAVACVQLLVQRNRWRYWLSPAELRQRLRPFIIPMLVFAAFSVISITVALSRGAAIRTFREEVLGPFVYVVLIMLCLRTRQDFIRLFAALFGTGMVIAIIGIIQYVFFHQTLAPDVDGMVAIDTVYGSYNSVGLLFDYTLPLGLAVVFSRLPWNVRLGALLLCVPNLFVLLQSPSRGTALLAFPLVMIFLLIFLIRNKRIVLIGGGVILALVIVVSGLFYQRIYHYVNDQIIMGHTNQYHLNTVETRVYLWRSAIGMIEGNPILGVGLDNWLCHYTDPATLNKAAPTPAWATECKPAPHYYAIDFENGHSTHMGLEPSLSHPHNIFLQVWVSIGIFGLLAFLAILVFFWWQFARILRYLARAQVEQKEYYYTAVVAIGAAMLAALGQGMVDSSFLEQDLAFCFWILIALLLLLRYHIGLSWKKESYVLPHESSTLIE